MHTVKASKRVNAGQLYDEIIAAVPELAPTPTGPDGKLEAKFVIEQTGPQTVLVHLPDDVDLDVDDIDTALKAHKRRPEKTVDPVADAMQVIKQRADQGDSLARAILTLMGQ